MENLNVDQISGILTGGILAFGAMGSVISFAMSILAIIGGWKIFNKFGEPGWKAFIPLYGTWVEYKYTWKSVMMIPVAVLAIGGTILMETASDGTALQMVGSVAYLAGWVLTIIAYHKRSKVFGHGVGFTIGQVVMPGVFAIILGFGKSRYIGSSARDVQDELPAENN